MNDKVIQNLKDWLNSPEGKKRLEEIAKKNREYNKKLQEAARVPDWLLRKRVTI